MQGMGLREVALIIYNRPSNALPPTTSLDSVAFFTHFQRGIGWDIYLVSRAESVVGRREHGLRVAEVPAAPPRHTSGLGRPRRSSEEWG